MSSTVRARSSELGILLIKCAILELSSCTNRRIAAMIVALDDSRRLCVVLFDNYPTACHSSDVGSCYLQLSFRHLEFPHDSPATLFKVLGGRKLCWII
jgi:hypothetical protein